MRFRNKIFYQRRYYIFLLLIFVFPVFLFKLFLLHPVISDETTYINMAKEVLNGKLPYRDFFFAHPPLQLFLLASLFKIFGLNFFIPKIFCLVVSFSSLIILYFVGKKLFDEKVALISSIFLLLWPGFLVFSDHAYGMWEIFFIFLVSMYLILINREEMAAILFSIGVFYRYLIALYFPFLLILAYLKKRETKKFFLFTFISTSLIFIVIYMIFGFSFIDNSILFQISTKIFEGKLSKQIFQYLDLGYFSLFLALISFYHSFVRKDKFLLLLSLYPIVADLFIFLSFRTIAYHYFLLSLPLVMLVTAKVFLDSEEKFIKVLIVIVFAISIYHNLPTFYFYLDFESSKIMEEIVELVERETSFEDSIFGEPVMTNYVSFITGRKISSDLLDSDSRHLFYEGEEKILEKLNQDPPKIFIDMNDFYFFLPLIRGYFLKNYELVKSFGENINYIVYKRK